MIVENKQYIIDLSIITVNNMLLELAKETRELKLQDDPAENLYFYLYLTSFLLVRLTTIMEIFCITYDVKGMTREKISEFVNEITKEITSEQ